MVNTERLLATFLDLVQIDNPSGGEGPIAAQISQLLESLGLTVEHDALHNLIARVPGEGAPLLLNAQVRVISSFAGEAILEGLRARLEQGGPHRAAEIVFTVQEEVGLRGAAQLDTSVLVAREGVTFDSGGDFGRIIVGAPSQDSLHVVVQGRAAHAGVAPERGINAIVVAASALANMPLGRIDHETTANIGIIKGGDATNIVPERVELWGEARSHDQDKLVAQVQTMVAALEAAARGSGARVQIEITHKYDAYRLSADLPIIQSMQPHRFPGTAELRAMGCEPVLEISGGGSDVNIFAQHAMQVANVSVGYREIHSTTEHIAVVDLERAAELAWRLLAPPH
jgi:tripeptide aminopeptidase